MSTWITLFLEVERANAKNHDVIYGCPSPSAAWGFAEALARRSKCSLQDGVAFILKEYVPSGARPFGQTQFAIQRSSERDVKGATQLDLPRCGLKLVLIFLLEVAVGNDPVETVSTHLYGARFAGGTISNHHVSTSENMAEAIRKAGVGRTPYLIEEPADTPEKLRAALRPRKTERDDQIQTSGWRTPTTIGHRLLETPQIKSGSRQGLRHAYTDPLIAVLGWESIRNHVRGTAHRPLTFWKPHWVNPTTVIFCKPSSSLPNPNS